MKKVTAIILTGILTLGVLTGCQSNSKAEEKGSSEDAKTIKVAASATPHAEILEQAKSILKKEGLSAGSDKLHERKRTTVLYFKGICTLPQCRGSDRADRI